MSDKNEHDPKAENKKKLKISKEVIEDLMDEDLDQVVGGGDAPPENYPRHDEV